MKLNLRCCPNFRCSAGFQPALSRQDGGGTFNLGQHPICKWRDKCTLDGVRFIESLGLGIPARQSAPAKVGAFCFLGGRLQAPHAPRHNLSAA
jgi:hypothetical protein